MQCPCGEETRMSSHLIKTIKKAREWHGETSTDNLPLTIEQDKCPACGRIHVEIYDGATLLEWRG